MFGWLSGLEENKAIVRLSYRLNWEKLRNKKVIDNMKNIISIKTDITKGDIITGSQWVQIFKQSLLLRSHSSTLLSKQSFAHSLVSLLCYLVNNGRVMIV